ncbi:MAG: hypothetical protein FWD17_00910 [Polyangiaceae bacterium]|nr:hypothetical protein [Polyangiaceae bacterium]
MKARSGRFAIAVAAFLALAAAASCKSQSSAPGSGGAPSGATPPQVTEAEARDACLVTAAEAAAAVGVPSFEPPKVTTRPPITDCMFIDAKATAEVGIRVEAGRTLEDFTSMRKQRDDSGHKMTDYPGVGEAAATFVAGRIAEILFAHKGRVILVHSYMLPLDRVIPLAKTIAAR